MKSPLIISTPIGELVEVRYMYPSCVVEIEEKTLSTDLIELAILDFDVILGMDWLSENRATINYYEKCVVFEHEEGKKSTLQCDRSEVPINLISLMKASKLLKKGC